MECDLWATADGVPVLLHDEHLPDLRRDVGEIWRYRWEEVAPPLAMIRGRQESGPITQTILSTLSSALGALNRPAGVLAEIKPIDHRSLVAAVVEMFRRRPSLFSGGHKGPWKIMSFHPSNLVHAWSIDPTISCVLLVETHAQLERAIREQWPEVYPSHDLLTRGVCDRLRASGSSVGVWTVNETPDIDRALELGVDMIITDEPHRVRAATEAMRSGT
jgi:glycerophosphoryl diester phosphodiesterase